MSLHASIRAHREAFSLEVDFELEAGEMAVVLGPNGSGKSTLVDLLAGVLRLDRGSIALNGRVLDNGDVWVPPRDRRVGVMFQDLLLFEHMSVADNVAFGPRSQGTSRRDAARKAAAWLERLGIGEQAGSRPARLSGGQQQRVGLARALASEPELLILDEPLSALDLESRPAVRRLLAQVLSDYEGTTLLVTHDPLEAAQLGRRLLILESGRLVQQGTLDEIRQRPRVPYAASLVGVNLFQGVMRTDAHGGYIEIAGGGPVRVPANGHCDGKPVLAKLHPHAIVLSLEHPDSSARNAFSGPIAEMSTMGSRIRVRVDANPSVTAEITQDAVDSLGLRTGVVVWASFKATELEVYPR